MPPTPQLGHLAQEPGHPERQPPGGGLKTAKHHLNPGSNLAKNPPPQRAEVRSLKPLKEKKQAPARRQKTQRNLARAHPERQPPGDGLKTAKHHLNPDANPAKNPPPQRAEVTSLKPIKEKKQAPARGQKTQRNLAQTRPKQQPPGDGLKTAKHHLNPDANPAKNPPPQRAEVTSLKPIKEKKQAPARGQKTQRNLAQTRPKQQPPGDGLKTAKHHLNPDANPAKNPPPQRGEVTSLKPLKEKKQAPARRQKTQRNLARAHPEQQPPGDGLKTAKHHLNPDANPAKNPPPQRAEVTSLKPIKEEKQAPARGQKTQRNLVQTRPKPQPAPLRTQKTSRSLPRTTPRPQLLHNGFPPSQTPLLLHDNAQMQTYVSPTPFFSPPPRKRRGVGGYIYPWGNEHIPLIGKESHVPNCPTGWDDSNEVCGCLNGLNPNEGIEIHINGCLMCYWMNLVCQYVMYVVSCSTVLILCIIYIPLIYTNIYYIGGEMRFVFQNLQVDLLQKDTMHQHIQRVHAQAVRRKFCAAYDAAWSWMDGTTVVVFQKLESFMVPAREFVIYHTHIYINICTIKKIYIYICIIRYIYMYNKIYIYVYTLYNICLYIFDLYASHDAHLNLCSIWSCGILQSWDIFPSEWCVFSPCGYS